MVCPEAGAGPERTIVLEQPEQVIAAVTVALTAGDPPWLPIAITALPVSPLWKEFEPVNGFARPIIVALLMMKSGKETTVALTLTFTLPGGTVVAGIPASVPCTWIVAGPPAAVDNAAISHVATPGPGRVTRLELVTVMPVGGTSDSDTG